VNAGESASKGRELLEHTAATALSATEAIAKGSEWRPAYIPSEIMFFTAIVTTATLTAVFTDTAAINLNDGQVQDPEVEEVPYLRFVKQLWSGDDYPMISSVTSADRGDAKRHTVMIINAAHFIEFLQSFTRIRQPFDD
jgi:hypothetical protein